MDRLKPTSAAVRGVSVSEPRTLPFLGAVKFPLLSNGPGTDAIMLGRLCLPHSGGRCCGSETWEREPGSFRVLPPAHLGDRSR